MFRHRRQLQRWAARVLLAWLFGLAAGVANACLVEAVSGPGGQLAASATAVHHGSHPPGDEQADRRDKANCVEFCEMSTVSLLSASVDLAHAPAAPPSAGSAAWTSDASPIARPAQVPDRRGAPPIPIAFLRLAL